MAKNKLLEIQNSLKEQGFCELSIDDLKDVAGGVITASQKKQLNDVLKDAKSADMSLDEVLGLVPEYYNVLHLMYPNVTLDEVLTYISDTWDSL